MLFVCVVCFVCFVICCLFVCLVFVRVCFIFSLYLYDTLMSSNLTLGMCEATPVTAVAQGPRYSMRAACAMGAVAACRGGVQRGAYKPQGSPQIENAAQKHTLHPSADSGEQGAIEIAIEREWGS